MLLTCVADTTASPYDTLCRYTVSTRLQVHDVPLTLPFPPLSPRQPPTARWNFPSPQRFFNALRRKGWNEVDPKDVQVIVSIHNTMNEYTWGKVMEYESLHSDEVRHGKGGG